MNDLALQKDIYLSAFSRLEETTARNGSGWLRQIRREAFHRFGDLGFPTTRDEEWRHTSIAPIAAVPFEPALDGPARSVQPEALSGLVAGVRDISRITFVNGRLDPRLSDLPRLPEGVVAGSLAAAIREVPDLVEPHLARGAGEDRHPFASLNTAFLQDGGFVRVPPGVAVEEPIYFLFLTVGNGTPVVSYPRVLVVAERGSQVKIVEGYAGLRNGVYFTNGVTEIVAGENAVVDRCKIQEDDSFHVGTTRIRQARNSTLTSHSISLGGTLVRNDLSCVLDGEGVDCTLNGLYLAEGTQHVDNHTSIDHAHPHSQSRELYKGVLAGESMGVFNGRVLVRKDAQKTDARQSNKNLLLSDDSRIYTKPELEIYADDVKCAHGATIGQLEEDAIFYLRSRGIQQEMARSILTYAFADEVLADIPVDPIRVRLEAQLVARFHQGRKAGAVR